MQAGSKTFYQSLIYILIDKVLLFWDSKSFKRGIII